MSVRTKFVSVLATSALALEACQSPPNENPSTQTAEESGTIVFENAVVREKGTEKDMTGIFGDLVNESEDPIIIEGFTSDLEAPGLYYEIHETIGGVMQEMSEALVLQPGETRVFEPGGDHFMIMGYEDPIPAGEVITINIILSTGDTVEVEVPVRALGAGDEDYGVDGELQGHTPDSGEDNESQ